MSRTARTQAITPKMYRHFAVLTLCITACIAVFADGESREVISAEIRKPQAQAASKAPLAVAPPRARRESGGWGGDGERIDGGDGVGAVTPGDGEFDTAPHKERSGGPDSGRVNAQVQGYEAIKPGNPALRNDIKNEPPSARRRKPPAEDPEQIDNMLSASAERSGSERTEF